MGEIITAKLTRKYQATIPKLIRERLQLGAGDTIIFDLADDQVILRRAPPLDMKYLASIEAGLGEWLSAEDEEAYGEL